MYQNRDWNWGEADREYRTAITLAPTSEAYQSYGYFLDETLGRFNEAVQMLEKAVQIDPTSGLMHGDLAWRLLDAGQKGRAREEAGIAVAVDSGYPESEQTLAVIHALDGQYDSALAQLSRFESRSGKPVADMRGNFLARAGRTVEARAILRQLESEAKREGRPFGAGRAMVLLGLDEPDSAIALLGAGVEHHEKAEWYNWKWATIRADPRFQAVLRRAGVAR